MSVTYLTSTRSRKLGLQRHLTRIHSLYSAQIAPPASDSPRPHTVANVARITAMSVGQIDGRTGEGTLDTNGSRSRDLRRKISPLFCMHRVPRIHKMKDSAKTFS